MLHATNYSRADKVWLVGTGMAQLNCNLSLGCKPDWTIVCIDWREWD